MNPDLNKLQSYPFEKLAQLKAGAPGRPDARHIALSIGEPQHATPPFIADAMRQHLDTLANYPVTKGLPVLREAVAGWLCRRYGLAPATLDPEQHCLPVAGTREALFAFAQAVVDRSRDPLVLMPNPFYQIYEGAALLAGARPWYMNTTAHNDFAPDLNAVPADVWDRCQLIYICSPGNPTGAVFGLDFYRHLLELADRHDFIIAGDECYSEIYPDETDPPLGLLQACAALQRDDYRRCVVFNSLSKRSNLPGLRSGFVAGDAAILGQFLRYRTYHGCALPVYSQYASIAAWSDERHVQINRDLYREKFQRVLGILQPVLEVAAPAASFYLWPATPIDDTLFTRELFRQQHVTVLPGSYLSRPTPQGDPGSHHVRVALVAPLAECVDAAQRIRTFVESL